VLHGAQLWVALPDAERAGRARPSRTTRVSRCSPRPACGPTVLLGDVDGASSPGRAYTPIVGVDVELTGPARLPLTPEFEHAVLTVSGTPEVDGGPLAPGRSATSAPAGPRCACPPTRPRACSCWAASRSRSRS
jgi:redox-sensitive bicupin YhaK (pirin superfamily)